MRMEREAKPQPKREMPIAERKILLEKERQEREQRQKEGVPEPPNREDEKERLKNTDTRVIMAIVGVVLIFVAFFAVRLTISNIPPKELDYRTFNFSPDRIREDVERRVGQFYQGFGALDINIVDDYTTKSAKRGFEQRISLLYVASKMTSQKVEIKGFRFDGFRIEDDHVGVDVSYSILERDQGGSLVRATDAVETLKLKYYNRKGQNKWMIYESQGSTPDAQSEVPEK